MDAARAYPLAFVEALTKSGWLAALIPEAYGGAGLPLRAAAVILEPRQETKVTVRVLKAPGIITDHTKDVDPAEINV